MTAFNLFDLYHPGGLPRHETERHQHGITCACGCGLRSHCTAEDLGIRGTPAMLEIARLKRLERERAVKAPAPGNPWKGATRGTGTVLVADPEDGKCIDPECAAAHFLEIDDHGRETRFHRVERPANVFTLPNGAVARVRTDRRFRV